MIRLLRLLCVGSRAESKQLTFVVSAVRLIIFLPDAQTDLVEI